MRRGFWFVVGAGAGVYVMVRGRRALETFTPEGFSDRVAGLQVGARLFADEVRTGMVEKETELRDRLQLATDAPPALASGGRHARRDDTPALTHEPQLHEHHRDEDTD